MRRALSFTLAASAAAHVAAGWLVLRGAAFAPPAPAGSLDPAPLAAGETFVVPIEPAAADPATATAADPATATATATAVRASELRSFEASKLPATPSPGAPAPAAASGFGAVGDRGAFDLVPTLARAFAQAASSDPIWAAVPFGDAGAVELTVTLDEHGALVSTAMGGGGSPALRRGVERTLALVGGRAFVAPGAVTRVRVAARVEPDQVHDGLHGDVFALGASGAASFFALAIGRRVDCAVTPLPSAP